jgi:hypothetical protein
MPLELASAVNDDRRRRLALAIGAAGDCGERSNRCNDEEDLFHGKPLWVASIGTSIVI